MPGVLTVGARRPQAELLASPARRWQLQEAASALAEEEAPPASPDGKECPELPAVPSAQQLAAAYVLPHLARQLVTRQALDGRRAQGLDERRHVPLNLGLNLGQLPPQPHGSRLGLPRSLGHLGSMRGGEASRPALHSQHVDKAARAPERVDRLVQIRAAGALFLDEPEGRAEEAVAAHTLRQG